MTTQTAERGTRAHVRRAVGALTVVGLVLAGSAASVATPSSGNSAARQPALRQPGVANLWVDVTGGACVRRTIAAPYAAARTCGSFQAAYRAARCGDIVGVRSGMYPVQSINAFTKACGAGRIVLFTSAPGRSCSDPSRVSMPSFSIGVSFVELQCMSANPAGGTSCSSISGRSHTTVVWNTIDRMLIHCAWFDSDHMRVTGSKFGPDDTCQTGMEDMVDFRANADDIDDVVFDQDTFATVTAPPDFECGSGKHVDSMQGYGISNLVISNSVFYGCPGQCVIFRPYGGGTPGPITIESSIFNNPQDPGQAVDIGSDSRSDGDNCNGPIVIENDTFVNGAAVHGGCWNDPQVIFRSDILNRSSCGFGGANVTYRRNVFAGGGSCGTSSKTCTPTYVRASTAVTVEGDYHLAASDRCASRIDAGAGETP
jgi:hypothetical protein